MRRARTFAALALSLMVAASGCLGGGDTTSPGGEAPAGTDGDPDNATTPVTVPDEAVSRVALADLTCDFVYPDGSTAVSCESAFDTAAVEQAEQPTFTDSQWLCVHNAESSPVHAVPYWIHWHPFDGKHGIYYEVPEDLYTDDATVHGLFYTPDGAVRVVWHGGGQTGFVPLPLVVEDFSTAQFHVRIYLHGHESATPALAGPVRAVWSLFDGRPYPVQEVSGHYFHEVTTGTDTNFPYSLRPFSLEGSDFQINVTARHLLDRVDAFTNHPLHQCSF
jgi:hypothetical protein